MEREHLIRVSLSQFSQLPGDSENNAGLALEVIAPLQAAQLKGITAVLVRHERKSDAEIADAGRGSSAFGGAVDVILRLRRLGAKQPTCRKLETLSRFEETPAELTLELTETGYISHDSAAVALEAAKAELLEALPKSEPEALSYEELEAATKQSRRTLERAVKELGSNVQRIGEGKSGSPYRFWMPERNASG